MNLISEAYRQRTVLSRPTTLSSDATRTLSAGLTLLLADLLALYVKIKNFRWHMSGRHFHDYRSLLDERRPCWPSCAMTTGNWDGTCGSSIRSAASMGKSQRQAWFRAGPTRRRRGLGFCSRPRGQRRNEESQARMTHAKLVA